MTALKFNFWICIFGGEICIFFRLCAFCVFISGIRWVVCRGSLGYVMCFFSCIISRRGSMYYNVCTLHTIPRYSSSASHSPTPPHSSISPIYTSPFYILTTSLRSSSLTYPLHPLNQPLFSWAISSFWH